MRFLPDESLRDRSEPEPLLRLRPKGPLTDLSPRKPTLRPPTTRALKLLGLIFPILVVLALTIYIGGRLFLHHAMLTSLPQVDGSLQVGGLAAPVTVQRDAHGVPHLRASTMDDLVFAQGYVTAQDRLWQMDLLRRHAAGELAELLGPSLVPHDRLQRTLQIRASADRAIAVLPSSQLHWLEDYARGVNASIAEQTPHLPVEFRLLGYQPAPWTPRDSILIGLVMFQDLGDSYLVKLDREAITARLPAATRDLLAADLYPVGSWRDHPPAQTPADLTAPQDKIDQVPLDESQSRLRTPSGPSIAIPDLLAMAALKPVCDGCTAGSNAWAISGQHTASGKPLLSNDPHLNHTVPGIWYESDLEAPIAGAAEPFHVSGTSLPGVPFIVIGHNQHIAWGVTVLGADVQDLYIEPTRNSPAGGTDGEFQSQDGTWRPIEHHAERIRVRFNPDILLDVRSTRHGSAETPILSSLFPSEKRTLSLRWTIQDPAVPSIPLFDINNAHDWPAFTRAFAGFGGPSLNLSYADDQGHIGYHAVGRIPLRQQPHPAGCTSLVATSSSTLPAAAATEGSCPLAAPDSYLPIEVSPASTEWSGYVPYDQLPQAYDPAGGILATANARITADNYPYPLTLNWAEPYRNERIWKLLANRTGLRTDHLLALQTDVYSDLDHTLAQRLAYALDHTAQQTAAAGGASSRKDDAHLTRMRQTADLLRRWDGKVETGSTAAAIVAAFRGQIWSLLLNPQLAAGTPAAPAHPAGPAGRQQKDAWRLYSWGERDYALEQIVVHEPARWLPARFKTWDDLLTTAVDLGLAAAGAPPNLDHWAVGATRTLDIEHPIFSLSPLLSSALGTPSGTGPRPQNGNRDTIQQVGASFGPSERFTADLSDLDRSTLSIVLGQSGDPLSPWFLDQFPTWLAGKTFAMPFSHTDVDTATTHTLTLIPR